MNMMMQAVGSGLERDLTLVLFRDCNLDCEFCCHRGKPRSGYDDFDPYRILNLVGDREFETATILGGELFQDKIPDFEKYRILFSSLRCRQLNVSSNFLFRKTDRVRALADEFSLHLTASYDPHLRYTKPWMLPLFLENVMFFKPEISIVLLSQAIDAVRGRDQIFEWMYKEGYEIRFDHYDPNGYVQPPSREEVVQFLHYLLKEYPKVGNAKFLRSIMEGQRADGKGMCVNRLKIEDCVVQKCCADLENRASKAFLECMMCKHSFACPGPCFRTFSSPCVRKEVLDGFDMERTENSCLPDATV